MTWADIMTKRDRLAAILRPHLGSQLARERANDIIQALVVSEVEDEDPSHLALRMLARDLERRTAEVVAYQLGRAWRIVPACGLGPAEPGGVAQAGTASASVDPRAAQPGVLRSRPSRSRIRGLWH